MSIAYTVDDVALTDPSGRWDVLNTSTVVPALTIDSSDSQVPGMVGSLPSPGQPASAAQMTIDMKILGTDQDSMWHYYTALAGLFARGSTLRRTVGTTTTSADMELQSIAQPVYVDYLSAFTTTVVVKLPGALWRADAGDWSQSNPTSGTNYAVSTLANMSGPVNDALYLLTGPMDTGAKLASGSGWLKVGSAIASGSAALVDSAAWTVRIGTDVDFDGGGTLTAGVLTNAGGPYVLPLLPVTVGGDPMVTTVKVKLTATGLTSSSAVGVRARSAYLV